MTTLLTVTTGGIWLSSQPASASGLSAAQLAAEYLKALGPADAAIAKAATALKALPITATPSEVEAIVAPLNGELAPLEALVTGSDVQPPVRPSPQGTPLESLPTPSFSTDNCLCSGRFSQLYSSLIGGAIYHRGFQLITGTGGDWNFDSAWASYDWRIGSQYSKFSGGFALDAGDGCRSTVVKILGGSGTPIPFTYAGKAVTSMTISKGQAPAYLSVDVSSQSSMSIWLGFLCNAHGQSVVDIVNDGLS